MLYITINSHTTYIHQSSRTKLNYFCFLYSQKIETKLFYNVLNPTHVLF